MLKIRMKDPKINMQEDNLKLFYNVLEEIRDISIWNYQATIKKAFQHIKKRNEEAIIELKYLNFNLNKGELLLNVNLLNENGLLEKIILDEKDRDYLVLRLSQTKNNFLISRYAHLLYQITNNNKYAIRALDNYELLINATPISDLKSINEIIYATIYLSKRIRHNQEKYKTIFINLLDKAPNESKPHILGALIDNKTITKEDKITLAKKIIKWPSIENPDEYENKKPILE